MNPFDQPDQGIALVVDDNPESLGMVSSALEAHGMTVLIARDGKTAIDLTRRVQPDVILMDAVMPEPDGFETCRILKSGPQPTQAPIIFMTGLSEQEDVVRGLNAGGVDYITKPVEIDVMIARLTTHLINSRLLQSARQAIDAVDRAVLAFNTSAGLVWGSEKAIEFVQTHGLDLNRADLQAWIKACAGRPVSAVEPFVEGDLSIMLLGFSSTGEILVKIVLQQEQKQEEILKDAFDLTVREAEVLYWLTLGKTNRDISTILSLSARTVNKHLEQVFQKMGVDNRTSAAVLADRKISNTE
ncbi:MAG: DNA-binding response regulator [Pseudomonadota bacterium]